MTHIEQIRQKTHRYFYEDGFVEIAVGMLFIFIGLLLLALNAFLEQSAPLAWAAALGSVILVIGAGFALKSSLNAVKEHITYPRTGYVSYGDRPAKSRWIIIGAAFILGTGALILNILADDLPAWVQSMSLIEGLLLGIVLATIGYTLNVRRFYAIGLIALLAALITALAGLPDITASTLTFSFTGLALIFSGTQTLTHYLRENARLDEEKRS